VAVEDLLDTGEYETVYNLRVADFHTYFVGGEEWGFSVWAHNACEVVQEWDALTTPKDGRRRVGSWLSIKDDETGYRARWFKPEGVDQAEVLRLAQIDSTQGLGAGVQPRIQGYADDWHTLPNSEKWTEGQLRRIKIELDRMNVIREQLGLEKVDPANFLNGETPSGLPKSASEDLQAQYYKSRTQAFQQRAAGQGDYVDTEMIGRLTRPGQLEVYGQGQPDLLFLPSQVRIEVFRGDQWSLHAQRLSGYTWRGMPFTPYPG
jgi:hypothetical protein